MSQTAPDLAEFNVVAEGQAQILFPKKADVFYNPIQEFNRDLSIVAITAWAELYGQKLAGGPSSKRKLDQDEPERTEPQPFITVLEGLAASGLRSIRYAKELPNVAKIVANDFSPEAVRSIERNVAYNELGALVTPNRGDASAYMHEAKASNRFFHIIDLDPYGTAAPFIDAAVQSVANDGMLLVTCTDLAVLAGNGYPEKCFALYGGTNITGDAVHESALRLVLNLLQTTAAKYKRTVEPLLSLSIDYYVRVFVRVRTSPIEVKKLFSKTMVSYVCAGCGSVSNQPLGKVSERDNSTLKYGLAAGPHTGHHCAFCGFTNHVTGPMYTGPLHNADFVDKVLHLNKHKFSMGTKKRIEGMLTLAKNELHDNFYFKPEKISSILKCQVPPIKLVAAALGNLGFQTSLTHCVPSAIKTDADWNTIWAVFKHYCLHKAPNYKKDKLGENTAGYKIMNNDDIKLDKEISFELNEHSGKIEKLRKLKIVRYQDNPTKNWGPQAKPK